MRGHSPMDDHWCFRLRTWLLSTPQPNPLLALWFLSPVCGFQDFPVLADLASEYATGPFAHSDSRHQHRRLGADEPCPDRRLQVLKHRSPLLRASRDHCPDPFAPAVSLFTPYLISAPLPFPSGTRRVLSSRMCSDEAAMASIKVFDPVSVPFSVLEELQQLRAKSSNSARRTNAFARRTNAFARRTNASNANSKGPAPASTRLNASPNARPHPSPRGLPSHSPRRPAANPARPTGATATACPPAPRLSMKSLRHPCLTRALSAVAPSGKQRSPHSIRRKSLDVP